MFKLKETTLHGCHVLSPRIMDDVRGRFVKVFHQEGFRDIGLEINFPEEYYSKSSFGVIRGMHFQTPPSDHTKLVFCVDGEVNDVILDMRMGSPTYGQFEKIRLSAELANVVYIPKGMAHGFSVLSQSATLVYKVSTVYDPLRDSGVLWNSFGVDWEVSKPIISERDLSFEALCKFDSPFTYEHNLKK